MIEAIKLSHKYPFGAEAPHKVSFRAGKNMPLCVLGGSESGKTSLLKTVAGLLPVSGGDLLSDGKSFAAASVKTRNVFLLHEDGGFFERKTAEYNISYPLRVRGHKDCEINSAVKKLSARFSLSGILGEKVKNLSPRDRLKINTARMFAREADAYLIDDPFKNVDDRAAACEFFLPLFWELSEKSTVIFATTEFSEAEKFGAETLVLNYGVQQQIGTAAELKANPETVAVYKYAYGDCRVFDGVFDGGGIVFDGLSFPAETGKMINPIYAGQNVTVCCRGDGGIKNIKIYDKKSECLIYFGNIV
jgi:ABC-type sugar transport system ATPase subunit